MPSLRVVAAIAVALAVLCAVPQIAPARSTAAAAEKRKELDPKQSGEPYEWTSAGGIVCSCRGPAKYDEAKGVNLTVILHGSNLTHGWGFANHDAKTFRKDDFVLVPDGTTSNGKGGFNFLPGDVKKFEALIAEAKKAMKVRAVFLYGHSQGSFFSLLYAGAKPDDIAGVVAHASGAWAETAIGPQGHRTAIVLMHGTQDPVVPYVQSAGAFDEYTKAGYPMVRLRSLEGWNHWPAEHNGSVPHTSQQIAWCEGMTTTDPVRLAAAFDVLANVSNDGAAEHDYAGLWSLAKRIESMTGAPPELVARAKTARGDVERLAADRAAVLALPEKLVFDGKPWVAGLPMFLRQFQAVPACEEVAKRVAPTLEAHRKDGIAHLRKHYGALKSSKTAEAFDEGVAAIESGFLWIECADAQFRKNLEDWAKDAKKLKLAKSPLKTYDAVVVPYGKAFGDAWKDWESASAKFGK